VLCRLCASGLRHKRCEQCGSVFRTREGRLCPSCRTAKVREAAKKREAQKRGWKRGEERGKEAAFSAAEADDILLKNGLIADSGIIPPEAILKLRLRLCMSQSEFGKALGAYRGWPYSACYISKLENGIVGVTPRLRRALGVLLGKTQHLHILPPAVYAVEQLPAGTVILGRPVMCPVCHGIFVMPWATQKYCSDVCRREARRQRRRRG
jgi:RNA polymerase subunit RPABC4/transcription elongation factor Spt4